MLIFSSQEISETGFSSWQRKFFQDFFALDAVRNNEWKKTNRLTTYCHSFVCRAWIPPPNPAGTRISDVDPDVDALDAEVILMNIMPPLALRY